MRAKLGSFRLKLLLWFALLALLPVAVALFGYDRLATRSETRRVDAALQSALRSAVAGYAARMDAADVAAAGLASDPALQQALHTHNRAALATVVQGTPGATVAAPGLRVGEVPAAPGGLRTVTVRDDRGRFLGRISVHVTLDAHVLASLGGGLAPGDRLVATRAGRIVAGGEIGAPVSLVPGRPARVRVGHGGYRGLATAPLDDGGLALAVLAPQQAIDVAAHAARSRVLAALLACLMLLSFVTYLFGRSIGGTLRRFAEAANALAGGRLDERVSVRGSDEFAQLARAFNGMAEQLQLRLAELETERGRAREATARFGETLVATHDPAQLMRIIVESAVEATGAAGGVVLAAGGELARAGDPERANETIAFPLRSGTSDFGSLVLAAPVFDAEQVATAASLAAQSVVALENAHLHRIVEQQALVDSLTGLANRRKVEETLRAELTRAERYGESVCLVLADLDDFKGINDRYGHPVGDEVLKSFAAALRDTVRESDVAGRWGGEEFALVLINTDAVGGARLAERARASFEAQAQAVAGGALTLTASFGVAAFPEVPEAGELFAAADAALYAAKRDGKNRVAVSAGSPSPKMV